jgi:hypothetical protein
MRHIKLFLFFIFISVVFIQCKKEDTTSSSPSIVGKWELVSSTFKQYKNNLVIKTGTNDIKVVGYMIQFNKDLSVIVTDKSGTYNSKYTITNSNIIIDGSNYTIVELTGDKLVLSYDNDVISPTTKEVVTETFKKIN